MPAGFINIIKPTGMTSNDLVAKLRGMLKRGYGEKIKVGHTGTLDPNASGVMLVALGRATKFTGYVMEKKKTYLAQIGFGKTTDTLDTYGKILQSHPPSAHSEDEIRHVLETFVGKSLQIPPKFSALKIDGKRLYQLAREGNCPQPQAREIEIESLELLSKEENAIRIVVTCSSGTYIRSLAKDIGEALGELAILTLLIRTDVDGFGINDAWTLDELEQLIQEKNIEQALLETEDLLQKFPPLHLKEGAKLYLNGATIRTRRYVGKKIPQGQYRVYHENNFLGIGTVVETEDCYLKSETMFI